MTSLEAVPSLSGSPPPSICSSHSIEFQGSASDTLAVFIQTREHSAFWHEMMLISIQTILSSLQAERRFSWHLSYIFSFSIAVPFFLFITDSNVHQNTTFNHFII